MHTQQPPANEYKKHLMRSIFVNQETRETGLIRSSTGFTGLLVYWSTGFPVYQIYFQNR